MMKRSLSPIILIPARMGSVRLPGKPLAQVGGVPMIVQVWRRAQEADIGPVVVACEDQAIFDAVRDAGGAAVLTEPGHLSGSDRIYEALVKIDEARKFNLIVNLQGDLPTIDKESVRATLLPFAKADCDMSTLVVEIKNNKEKSNPDVVKAAVAFANGARIGRALYFSRMVIPAGDGPIFHHIGIYAYRRAALERFINLPPGILERRERLEQLRAIENGLCIYAARVDTCPIGVDTLADLRRAREFLNHC